MSGQGSALIGIGMAQGENKAIEAAQRAIQSPLLEAKIDGATNAIVNITGGMDITIYDANEAVEFIREAAGGDVDIIFGVAINEDVGDSIIVTVIATGFDFDSKVADPKDYKSRVKKEAVKTISKELGTEVEVEDLNEKQY